MMKLKLWRNKVAVLLIIISFILLIPGLYQPILTIEADANILGAKVTVFKKTRSIIQTVRHLHQVHHNLVAFLILTFSVLIPFFKGIALLVCLSLKDPLMSYRLFVFIDSISKWSMADVFTVGTLVSYLTSKASIQLDAQFGVGFYYFVGYCLVSLLALQFMQVDDPRYQKKYYRISDDESDDEESALMPKSTL